VGLAEKSTLGDLLAANRAAAGLTQRQLAAAVGYARVTVATAESGHRQPAEAFWVRCDDRLGAGGELRRAYAQLAMRRERRQRNLVLRDQVSRVAHAGVTQAAVSGRDVDFMRPAATLTGGAETNMLAPLRAVVAIYPSRDQTSGASRTATAGVEAHRLYQRADYAAAARVVTDVLGVVGSVESDGNAAGSRQDLKTAAVAYLVASKLAVKAGDAALAWLTADRAAARAALAGDRALHAASAYQVAGALLAAGRLGDAERVALTAADDLARLVSQDARTISVRGSLLLLAALIAARGGRAVDCVRQIRAARHLADQLGRNGNQLWTGFGSINVAIHEISTTVDLDNPDRAIALGADLDTSALPAGLAGRRSQVHLDLAGAHVRRQDDAVAVLHLLEAERSAPQVLTTNAQSARLIDGLLRRERRDLTPGLLPLAQRAGLVP
jgi:Helix-turn-helix domain